MKHAISSMVRWVFRRPEPPIPQMIAARAASQRINRVSADYEEAIAREAVCRGRALHLYRTEGASARAMEADADYGRAIRHREQAENAFYQLSAERTYLRYAAAPRR